MGPIADYIEWTQNRYNPGHWLGGRTPPTVKNLWSTKDRRWLAAFYLTPPVLLLVQAFRNGATEQQWVGIGAVVLVYGGMGLIMLLSRDGTAQHKRRRRR